MTFSRPWGFDPDAITAETQLWYGAEDTIAPAQMGEYLGERIPTASLTILPGEGHMAVFTHWRDMIGALTTG